MTNMIAITVVDPKTGVAAKNKIGINSAGISLIESTHIFIGGDPTHTAETVYGEQFVPGATKARLDAKSRTINALHTEAMPGEPGASTEQFVPGATKARLDKADENATQEKLDAGATQAQIDAGKAKEQLAADKQRAAGDRVDPATTKAVPAKDIPVSRITMSGGTIYMVSETIDQLCK